MPPVPIRSISRYRPANASTAQKLPPPEALDRTTVAPVADDHDVTCVVVAVEGRGILEARVIPTRVLRGRCNSEPAVTVRDPVVVVRRSVDLVEFRDRR
jgi:hypothetical protein